MYNIPSNPTSYFSDPGSDLDEKLFEGMHLRSWVRNSVLRFLFDHLAVVYQDPHRWVKAWLAGSGVSYQWESERTPGDLDCLVGIDYVTFRRFNSDYAGLSNEEIASMFNEDFANNLLPLTSNWEGFELTYYVNPQTNIVDINPYSAYDLINDEWTVEPSKTQSPPYSRAWEQSTEKDYDTAAALLNRYSQALAEFNGAASTPNRVNAERKLMLAIDQAAEFYETIHKGRKLAFSKTGAGYADYHNYRWQAGKQSGIIQELKLIKDYKDTLQKAGNVSSYGVELPNTNTLIRRAALRGIK